MSLTPTYGYFQEAETTEIYKRNTEQLDAVGEYLNSFTKGGVIMKTLFGLVYILILSTIAHAADPGYHVIEKLRLGGEGGWDYLTVDSTSRRLYISRGAHVIVIDIDSKELVGDIPDTPGVHGIAIAPELNRGFTSNGRANTSSIFDLKTLKLLGHVKTGDNPDATLYDPSSKRVFTFNGRSKDATVFDASTGDVVKTLALGGKPEFAVADGKGKVYVNIEDANEVVELDSVKLAVVKRYSLKPCEGPTGMGLDPSRRRVFSGCHNKVLTVLDAEAGRVIAVLPIGQGVDGNGYDPGTGLAFSSNGDGTLTVVRETSPNTFTVVETVPTERGARTMAIDLKTHRIYLPTANFSPPGTPTPDNPHPRSTIIEGSFAVLVVGY